ncbi:hypothetical protein SNE40_020074 [Patella caerulea]|uniref:Cornifelin n=1 Tax=Patella caerulea TaxID=87958 RepID=A0AAN8J132_PATCE
MSSGGGVVTQQPAFVTMQPVGNFQAPAPNVFSQQKRPWSSDLMGCMSDIGPSCLMATFCGPCFFCYLSTKIGENCCVPGCVPGGIIAIRTKIRTQLGIEGTICGDCFTMSFCGVCALCQMTRELQNTNQWR